MTWETLVLWIRLCILSVRWHRSYICASLVIIRQIWTDETGSAMIWYDWYLNAGFMLNVIHTYVKTWNTYTIFYFKHFRHLMRHVIVNINYSNLLAIRHTIYWFSGQWLQPWICITSSKICCMNLDCR